MRNGRKILIIGTAMLALGGAPGLLFAQQTDEPAKPAARVYPPLATSSPADAQSNGEELAPDSRSLTGAQTLTLGSPEMRHSYWVPGLEYGNLILSSSMLNTTVKDWNSTSYVAGNLSVRDLWRHAGLNLNYSGGGYFSTDNAVGNGQFHQLGFLQQFDWRKWQLALIDQFSYLPQTQFGFAAGTNLAVPGIGGGFAAQLPDLLGSYIPSQSIYSAVGPRESNAFVAQLGYTMSRRSYLTFAGSYGLLHFTESVNIDTYDTILSAGYNYELSRFDTLGVVYRFTAYHFANEPQALGDQTVQFAYGRKLTGRLGLQLFGGPEITEFRVPVGPLTQHIAGAGAANLTYRASERTNLSVGFTHGVAGGSGVFTGTVTDQVEGSLDHQFSRSWHGGTHFGYARNSAVATVNSQSLPSFDNWFAGVSLGRSLGRTARLNFAYTANIQNSSLPVSIFGQPTSSFTLHQITVDVGWSSRPLVIR